MKQTFLAKIRECEGQIDEFSAVHPISEYAKKMLAMVNGEEIAFARRENMRHLWSRLHEMAVQKGANGSVKFRMVPGLERSFERMAVHHSHCLFWWRSVMKYRVLWLREVFIRSGCGHCAMKP